MAYDLERALKTAAKIGVVGLGAAMYGGAADNELLQNLGYLTMGASAVGAIGAGLKSLIDRERPKRDHNPTNPNITNIRELSQREIYNRQRQQQEYEQRIQNERQIRQIRYDRKRARARNRIRQRGIRGTLLSAWYKIKGY